MKILYTVITRNNGIGRRHYGNEFDVVTKQIVLLYYSSKQLLNEMGLNLHCSIAQLLLFIGIFKFITRV